MREPTEAEITAVISAMTSRAPAYDGPTNSLDRMTLLAKGIAQAVLAAGHSDPVTAPGLDRAAVLAAALGVLDGWHDGNRDRKAAEITDAIFALAATPCLTGCRWKSPATAPGTVAQAPDLPTPLLRMLGPFTPASARL